ncbi:MAG: DUF3592 domain-containing protein [Candidatus Accumulibacter sp.]|uniref:DUF3592 domain-containing protein n=1 Tax=Accumulibacter sp. TaxID=2053492 RepID=UPI001A53AE02|nr:DUF3592 domain-containing protein [Accumulibacter sp.]MBL8391805.1 DUF3592 domain-containing protein [Accumulibacter sp.]HRD89585.1 DUF3592 domain-containing protein [Accumulibacter sp.]
MSNAAFRMLGWGLELAGLLLLVTGCMLAWSHWRRTRGWRTAPGTVIDQAARAPTPGNPYDFPVVEFTSDDGRQHRFESNTGRYVRPLATGTRVDVLHDPMRLEQAVVDRFADRWFAAAGLAGLGVMALLLGLMFVTLA